MKRWVVFKEKRDKFVEYFIEFKNKQVRNRRFVTLILLQRMLRYLSTQFNSVVYEEFQNLQRSFRAFRMQFRLKRLILKKGPSREIRNVRSIRE
jgi:hypothetical protein